MGAVIVAFALGVGWFAQIREAYRFAVANRDTLRYIPCFCGCGAEGHVSNASCYLKDFSGTQRLEFDRMSLG